MKRNSKILLTALIILLAGNFFNAFVNAHEQKQENHTQSQETLQEKQERKKIQLSTLPSSHVIAVIGGKPLTVAEIDEWTKIVNRGADEDVSKNRMQTLRAIINLKAFAHAALAEHLEESMDFKKRLALMQESILQQLYIDEKITTSPSYEELKKRYEDEVASLPSETEVHARHILVKTNKEAKDLINKLKGGVVFEDLAKEKSTDGSASLGGDLGYFTKGQMVKPFEDAAFALKIGEYSKEPVESPFGWHIIKVEDIREKKPPTLEEATSYLQNVILRERYKALQKRVLSDFDISYPDKETAKAMQDQIDEDDSSSVEFDEDR